MKGSSNIFAIATLAAAAFSANSNAISIPSGTIYAPAFNKKDPRRFYNING